MSIVGPILVVNSLVIIVIYMEVLKKEILRKSIESIGDQNCCRSELVIVTIIAICFDDDAYKDPLARVYVTPCYHCFCNDCLKEFQETVSLNYV